MKAYRLEFSQPDGRWTGPYTAEWMTPEALEVRARLRAAHKNPSTDRPFPDVRIFAENPGSDRYVSACKTVEELQDWFGEFLAPLQEQGGYIGTYEVPEEAVALDDGRQIIYQQRQGVCVSRNGRPVDEVNLVLQEHPSKAKG